MAMSEKLTKNLNFLMTEARLSAEELSRRIGLPPSTIKKIRNSVNLNPTLSTLSPLAAYFSLTLSQLVGDEPFPKGLFNGSPPIKHDLSIQIPLISWRESITWPEGLHETHSTIATEHEDSKTAYALMVEEEDWENVTKGTILIVDPELQAEHRDFVIVHKAGQEIPSLKTLLINEGERYLKPVTSGYSIVALTLEYRILGVVVEYKKNLKKKHQWNNEVA
jgi:SOS-response transcriptional repressor LexA